MLPVQERTRERERRGGRRGEERKGEGRGGEKRGGEGEGEEGTVGREETLVKIFLATKLILLILDLVSWIIFCARLLNELLNVNSRWLN